MLPFAYSLAERTWHDQHFAQALTLHCSHTLGRAQVPAQSRIWSIEWQLGGILEELNIVCPVCTSYYLLLRQEFPHGLRSIAKKVHEAPAIRVARAKLNGLCKACMSEELRVGIYRVAGITVDYSCDASQRYRSSVRISTVLSLGELEYPLQGGGDFLASDSACPKR